MYRWRSRSEGLRRGILMRRIKSGPHSHTYPLACYRRQIAAASFLNAPDKKTRIVDEHSNSLRSSPPVMPLSLPFLDQILPLKSRFPSIPSNISAEPWTLNTLSHTQPNDNPGDYAMMLPNDPESHLRRLLESFLPCACAHGNTTLFHTDRMLHLAQRAARPFVPSSPQSRWILHVLCVIEQHPSPVSGSAVSQSTLRPSIRLPP